MRLPSTMTRVFACLVAASLAAAAPACAGDGGGGPSTDDAKGVDAADVAAAEDVADAAETSDAPDIDDTGQTGPVCNPILQEGCDEGEKCSYDSQDEITCTKAGELPYGAICEGGSQCAGGTCISLNGTESFCYQYCKTKIHCDNGGPCIELQDSPYRVCEISGIYDSCTLLAAGCEAGKGCYVVSGEDTPVCLPEGQETTHGTCSSPNDCVSTHTCINDRCLELCHGNDDTPCGDAFTPCVLYYGNIGYCDN